MYNIIHASPERSCIGLLVGLTMADLGRIYQPLYADPSIKYVRDIITQCDAALFYKEHH